MDAGRLSEITAELQEISAVDFPNIPVLYSQEVVASSSDITGYQATVYGLRPASPRSAGPSENANVTNKPPRGGGLRLWMNPPAKGFGGRIV